MAWMAWMGSQGMARRCLSAAAWVVLAGALEGCGTDPGDADPKTPSMDASSGDGGGDGGFCGEQAPAGTPREVSGACRIVVETPPKLNVQHVPVDTPLPCYANPPSNGPHFPVWAAYKTYGKPVPRGYYVHNLEHGAIVLLYKCDSQDGCPDIVKGLEEVAAALPDDPFCAVAGPRVRVIITPDPLLDVPVAAAAWGFTYKADCLDKPSLEAFAKENYGKGPERTCSNGADLP